jgi:ADP-heptose:LPS heptosyltransferase
VRKLILTNFQSPGDVVMLTAAVRDLHRSHPGEFLTDVRTPCSELWENNPDVTPLDESASDVEVIPCHYPMIHRSNHTPGHFVQGFTDYLSNYLGVPIEVSAFRGAIYLSDEEKSWRPQVDGSFWIIDAGGKSDFTVKWWDSLRFQQVVDHYRGRLRFVQIGGRGHHHPALRNVIDLRGRTDLRQLIRLVYHSAGVLTPVSLPMHLAAAVEMPPQRLRHRPCVVVAGGREPPHWEAYPHHQFIHTVGSLGCCDNGGCWKSRTAPLGDGEPGDLPENLCVDVRNALPACMDMITAADVIRRIEMYL